MTLQPPLFDEHLKRKEQENWNQTIEAIPIEKDVPGTFLQAIIPATARLELTRHYEIHSIHISRILHLLGDTKGTRLTIEQIAQNLSIPSARTEATLSLGRKAGMISTENGLTRFGELVLKENPYFDDKGLLWLLHFLLASNANLLIWSMAFNDLSIHKEEVDLNEITQILSSSSNKWSEKTLKKKAPAELRGTLTCYTEEIFSALNLVTHVGSTRYEFNSDNAVIPSLIWLSCILIYRDQYYPGAPSLEIPLIINGNFSPGRILRQSQLSVRKALDELHNSDLLTVEARSGLDQVRFKREATWLWAAAQHLKAVHHD